MQPALTIPEVLTFKIKIKKHKKVATKQTSLFNKLPEECLCLINDYLRMKDDFITYKRYFINNLNVALTNKYLYNIFLIRDSQIKTLVKEEANTEIVKSQAKQNYGLTDKDMEDLDYREKQHHTYRRIIMKIYNLADVMDCAYLKHGSYFIYKTRQQIKKNKRENKKLEKEMAIEEKENERKEQVNKLVAILEKNNVKYNFSEIENAVITNINESYQHLVLLDNRRTELKQRLEQTNIEYDLKNDVENKIFSNVDIAFQYMVRLHDIKNLKTTRKNELAERLQHHGLTIRGDSVLCGNYVNYGIGSIDNVVNTMAEMDFFYKHTSYPSIYKSELNDWFREQRDFDGEYYHDLDSENRIELSNSAKRTALKRWVLRYNKNDDPLNCSYLPVSLREKVMIFRR